MTDSAAEQARQDAALVREARAKIVAALNLTPLVPPNADTETLNIVNEAWFGLSRLAAAAERADELEMMARGYKQEWQKADAALLVAQQERDAEHEARVSWETAARSEQRQWARAEATNTRLREALQWVRLALGWAVFRENRSVWTSNELRDITERIDVALAPDAEQENA